MSAEERRTLVVGHLVLAVFAALAGSAIVVNTPGGVGAYALLLVAIWTAVRELANAADLEFDVAWQWAYDDGSPRSGTWTDPAAVAVGEHLRDLVDRLEHPVVHEPIAVGQGIEVEEIVEILDDPFRP